MPTEARKGAPVRRRGKGPQWNLQKSYPAFDAQYRERHKCHSINLYQPRNFFEYEGVIWMPPLERKSKRGHEFVSFVLSHHVVVETEQGLRPFAGDNRASFVAFDALRRKILKEFAAGDYVHVTGHLCMPASGRPVNVLVLQSIEKLEKPKRVDPGNPGEVVEALGGGGR